jgi:hypothetical protein
MAASVAEEMSADLLITDRDYLLEDRPNRRRGDVFAVAPDDALPLVGLYLRRQGQYVFWRSADGHGSYNGTRFWFYFVATRAVLPDSWRWVTACQRQSEGSGDDHLFFHARSLLQRVEQALMARDDVFAALSAPQGPEAVEDVMMALDRLLILLNSAVDVTARVAHVVLGVHDVKESLAGWKVDGAWIKNVRQLEPQLARLTGPGRFRDSLTILRLLRNTIHGAALGALPAHSGAVGEPVDTLVELPKSESGVLRQCAQRQGGETSWGFSEIVPGKLHADIATLVERLFREVMGFLNEVMRLTPVERMPHSALTAADYGAPQAPAGVDTLTAFSDLAQSLVLAQLALP